MPLIAVLRGLPKQDAPAVARTVLDAGFTVLEVTVRAKSDGFASLNPDALRCLELLIATHGAQAHIAAGTVKDAADIDVLRSLGIEVALAPNFNADVVAAARRAGMAFIPGVETLSEADAAFRAGASGIKVFPCVVKNPDGGTPVYRHSPGYIRTLTEFMPGPIYPSGGIDWASAPAYMSAGAAAINIGGELYKPGRSLTDIADRARKLTAAMASYAP
jgi:2-dehydro-3-deoxyphosphogalactonate aldolase